MKNAIIFLNGEINLQFCEEHIHKNHKNVDIYCADGSFDMIKTSSYLMKNLRATIGDKDSIKSSGIPKSYFFFKNQNYTDFEKCLIVINSSVKNLIVYGMNGKEMDHYLGNLHTSLLYTKKFSFNFIDQYGYSRFLDKNNIIKNCFGKTISILPLPIMKNVSIIGCKYKVDKEDLFFGKLISIRNIAISNEVAIRYSEGNGIIFISHK